MSLEIIDSESRDKLINILSNVIKCAECHDFNSLMVECEKIEDIKDELLKLGSLEQFARNIMR